MAEKERLRLNGHVNRARDPELFDALISMDDRLRMGRLRELANLGLRAEAVLRAGTDRKLGENFEALVLSAPPAPPARPRPAPAPQREAAPAPQQRPVTTDSPEPISKPDTVVVQPSSDRRKRMLAGIDTSIMG